MSYKNPDKQRTYQCEWMKRRRMQWVEENGPCRRCGSWDNLEVDHIDPAQKVSHRIWSWSEPRRLAELEKCQVLCTDCHLEKSVAESTTAECGSERMYRRGCRCAECRATHTRAQREWRAKARR